jgi:hypothetical protein
VNDCKVAELCIAAMPPAAELVAEQGVSFDIDRCSKPFRRSSRLTL